MAKSKKIAFTASDTPEAQEAKHLLSMTVPQVEKSEADVIVALGGDGFLLQTLHDHMGERVAIYGMNQG